MQSGVFIFEKSHVKVVRRRANTHVHLTKLDELIGIFLTIKQYVMEDMKRAVEDDISCTAWVDFEGSVHKIIVGIANQTGILVLQLEIKMT